MNADQKMLADGSVVDKKAKKPRNFVDYLVINPRGKLYIAFKSFNILLCLVSSFVYAFYAAFRLDTDGNPNDPGIDPTLHIPTMDNIEIFFECQFFLDCVTKFFLEYTDDLNNTQIRDI